MATDRPVTLRSPLGDALLFSELNWSEALGSMPTGQLTMLSTDAGIDANDLLGRVLSVAFLLPGGRSRAFNGYVTRFARGGVRGRFFRYHAELHPWLWFLARTSDCRIFLGRTVVEILQEVFGGHPVAKTDFSGLYGTYPTLTQCVQYRETDLNFAGRLMERNGIYYAFDYDQDGRQTMRFFDATACHADDPNLSELPFLPAGGRLVPSQGHLSEWGSARTVQPGTFVTHGFSSDTPNTRLTRQAGAPDAHGLADYEIYDSAYAFENGDAGDLYVRVVNDQSGSEYDVYSGRTNAYDLRTACTVTVKWHADAAQNAKYLVTAATYQLAYPGHESDTAEAERHYECSFHAIPISQQFRTPARTPKPFVQGPQLGTVTGPAGDEIYTDDLGRVKVVFHWDRYGTRGKNKGQDGAAIPPEQTSCWVPVSQPWAGNRFGAIQLPRIKQEVIVDFLEGDPDRPVITGRVYNRENPPPWTLPDNKTQSGILTRSSLSGSASNANALRFEDKMGSEEVWLHAEKDQRIEVEHDESHWVGHDRSKTIDNDETVHVQHDRTETVDNNETITVHNDRRERVDNNETISVGVNRTEDVGANETIRIGINRTEIVGSMETITIGSHRTVAIGGNKAETIALAKEETIGLAKLLTIGGLYQITVGGAMNTTVILAQAEEVGLSKSIKVGRTFSIDVVDEFTVNVGKSSFSMRKDGTIIFNGHTFSVGTTGEQTLKADADIHLQAKHVKEN